MTIRPANLNDLPFLEEQDRHIGPEELTVSVSRGRVMMAEEKGTSIGWLRWNLFWDNTPFMNMLFVLEQWRGRQIGRELVLTWERQMWELGYETVLTSTASNEYAQHFYEKLGYRAIGGFTLPGEPYELILAKSELERDFHHKEEF